MVQAMHTYEEIKLEILKRINDRTWPVGFTLPHEEKLAEEFNVARGTIRQALSNLVDAGLIERRRRAGTRVAKRTAHSSKLTISLVRHEVETTGCEYGYRLIANELKGGSSGETDAKYRHVIALHLSDGRPYQLEDRLINLETIPEANEEDFEEVSPNEWLLSRVPYSSVRTTLRAEAGSNLDHQHLDLKDGEPVFVIERQTHLNDNHVTSVRMSHPATRFQITTVSE